MKEREQQDPEGGAFDPAAWLHPGVREVHRDEVLWVLDKPPGVLSHPNPPARESKESTETSRSLLEAPYDSEREMFRLRPPGGRERQVYLLHRLDLETSGLILCAFEPGAAKKVKQALYRREVEKEYQALVLGAPRRHEGEWADHLEKTSRGGRVEVRVRPRGRPNAFSRFRVLRRFPGPGLALLALAPGSGRTHQLRVQAASRGLPIAGDDRYGDFTANRFLAEQVGLDRMFLHASGLTLLHPSSGERVSFRRDPGDALSAVLERLAGLAKRVPRRRR